MLGEKVQTDPNGTTSESWFSQNFLNSDFEGILDFGDHIFSSQNPCF
jgi:hypothetical protein